MASSDFTMPEAELSQNVWWYHSKDSKPQPAMVVQVGDRALHLAVFIPGFSGSTTKNGVPHISDTRVKNNDGRGFWDHTPRNKEIDKLRAELVGMTNVIPGEE